MENITLIGMPTARITTPAELAAAGYLARYNGKTRESYRTSLKILWDWCGGLGVDVLAGMRRPVLELFARYLEDERHNCPATVAHHLRALSRYLIWTDTIGYDENMVP